MKICKKCVLPETYPGIMIDDKGICNFCREKKTEKSTDDFKTEADLIQYLGQYKGLNNKYDVLVPLSGGVDSSNSLITIVKEFKLRALGFHLDNGYEDPTATENVKKLCKKLNVDLIITQSELGFFKKLWKYINEAKVKGVNACYVCGNILYINALELAEKYGISLIINGYSKGQARMMSDKDISLNIMEKIIKIIDNTGDREFYEMFMDKFSILSRQIVYQKKEDFTQTLEQNKILVLPFYIFDFYKTDKEKLKNKITKEYDWKQMRTDYPGRTTNCEMVWLNTYVDLVKTGYSLYHVEYAELVRRGEMARQQALEDLEFLPPEGKIEKLAEDIGLDLSKLSTDDISDEEEDEEKLIEIDFEF